MTAPAAARTRIASVEVVDWAEIGPLCYGEMSEDGDTPILRPDRAAVVVVETANGDLFTYEADFGLDFDRANRFAARVAAAKTVDLDRWAFWRVRYGSAAYVEAAEVEFLAYGFVSDLGDGNR